MCLIIDKPIDIEISKQTISHAAHNNPHGWGIMFAENNAIVTAKGLKIEELLALNDDLVSKHVLYHFRQATHGKVDVNNCHPYRVTDSIYLMHNGIVNVPNIVTDMSDSFIFATYVLGPILASNPNLFGTKHLEEIIEQFDGSSKFALLDANGISQIINKDAGYTSDLGVWYSNKYSLQLPVPAPAKPTYEKFYKFIDKRKPSKYDSYDSWYWESEEEKLIMPTSYDELLAMDYDSMLRFVKECPEETADLLYQATDFDACELSEI